MTPQEFVAKWERSTLSERSACQQHFLDLCDLLGQETPAAADPDGDWYTFEKGVGKSPEKDEQEDKQSRGFADVWMKDHFGWEYKGKHRNLKDAYAQLLRYRESLDNPPLLVVCDMNLFEIHTNFTGTAKRVYSFSLKELDKPRNLDVLRRLFDDPNSLKPELRMEAVTEEAAREFAALADSLRERFDDPNRVAHFLMKLMFCMFAEDIRLLPEKLFSKLLDRSRKEPEKLSRHLSGLFQAMAAGGEFALEEIMHFNGGLFTDGDALDLTLAEISKLTKANDLNWEDVEPSVFGTLFERLLDPSKRSQIGAHYTSRDDILLLLEPVMMKPLRREWEDVQKQCEKLWPKVQKAAREDKKRRKDSPARRQFDRTLQDFIERISHVTVLDPACGSGNFLYVALNLLLDLEKEVITYAAGKGLPMIPHVRPTQLAGIEINPFAQELAQVVIWIGYLQWMHHNGFNPPRNPVLDPIENIQRMDAIIDLSNPEIPLEPEWPAADFIVGNPPFLGDKKMRGELGSEYVDTLRRLYRDRLPGQLDLCCYWFEKTRVQIQKGKCGVAGLLATQGIRGGSNRTVLDKIKASGNIFWAMSDRNWILEGATVHVSIVGFDDGTERDHCLDGVTVETIHANLTSGHLVDVTRAKRLRENSGVCFLGVMKAGDFDISEATAISFIRSPNPHGCQNSDVLRPRLTARDILQRQAIGWIIDFGIDAETEEASKYALPWKHVEEHVLPSRRDNRRKRLAEKWWIHGEARPGLRNSLRGLKRFIVTPEVSKHRVFSWLDDFYLADHQTRAFSFDDDYSFGVLHSRVHEVWARSQGTQLRERESGFRYTPTSCFETFPFPEPTDDQTSAIAEAAADLDRLRNNWLNPPEWSREEFLEFPGSIDGPWKRYITDPNETGIGTVRYPRIVPKDDESATKLKRRTLTNLYNERPTWLDLAHKKLDETVFAAYGWDPAMTDDELLAALLELNLSREPA